MTKKVLVFSAAAIYLLTMGTAKLNNESVELSYMTREQIQREYFQRDFDRPFAMLILENCQDLDPFLVAAIIEVESEWNPTAVSSAGAIGLMQTIPGVSTPKSRKELFNPRISIREGCQYFLEMKNTFTTDETALAAYNLGPSKVIKLGIRQNRYSKKVLQEYRRFLKEYEKYVIDNYYTFDFSNG